MSGLVSAALQLGLTSLLVKPKRGIFGTDDSVFIPAATIREQGSDDMEITEHPIEQGATISDHAFKRPADLTIHVAWSNSPGGSGSLINAAIGYAAAKVPAIGKVVNVVEQVNAILGVAGMITSALSGGGTNQMNSIYNELLDFQANAILSTIYTGRRTYENMLIKSIALENDFKTENALYLTIMCKEVILVDTSVETISNAANPTLNSPTTGGTSCLAPAATYTPPPYIQ